MFIYRVRRFSKIEIRPYKIQATRNIPLEVFEKNLITVFPDFKTQLFLIMKFSKNFINYF